MSQFGTTVSGSKCRTNLHTIRADCLVFVVVFGHASTCYTEETYGHLAHFQCGHTCLHGNVSERAAYQDCRSVSIRTMHNAEILIVTSAQRHDPHHSAKPGRAERTRSAGITNNQKYSTTCHNPAVTHTHTPRWARLRNSCCACPSAHWQSHQSQPCQWYIQLLTHFYHQHCHQCVEYHALATAHCAQMQHTPHSDTTIRQSTELAYTATDAGAMLPNAWHAHGLPQ
jgi:hypothetical protein